MSARVCPVALLIGLAAQSFCQAPVGTVQHQPRLMAYDTFFRRVLWAEDRATNYAARGMNGTSSRAVVAREFSLTDREMGAVIAAASDWRTGFKAVEDEAKPLLAAGQSSRDSVAVQDLLQRRLKVTSDQIDRLRTALGTERFAALDALVTKPRPSPPPAGFFRQEYVRLAPINAFFGRVSWLEDRANTLARGGKVGPLTRSASAREFGLTAAEQALVKPIVADWQAKGAPIARRGQQLSAAGITDLAASAELQSVEADRQKNLADHAAQLEAALGPERFAALNAFLKKTKPLAGGLNRSVLAVLDVDGKTTPVSFAGMGFQLPEFMRMGHSAAFRVYTPDGVEEFGWETVSTIEISGERARVALRTGETVVADLPPGSRLDGETDRAQRVDINFSRIKTITAAP